LVPVAKQAPPGWGHRVEKPNMDDPAWSGGAVRIAGSAMSVAHYDAHQVGQISGPELFHDPGAVDLDRPWADTEMSAGFSVGWRGTDLLDHLAPPLRQQIAAGKLLGQGVASCSL